MTNAKKEQLAFDALILLTALSLLTYITRLWPLLLLIILGIFVGALRLLYLKAQAPNVILPPPRLLELPPPETELSVMQKAFGLLQCRITEYIVALYPGARWVWSAANPFEAFRSGEQLIVILNGAGGFQKAQVSVQNLQFNGLTLLAVTQSQATPLQQSEQQAAEQCPDISNNYSSQADIPVNYGRLAFEWVDSNIEAINEKCNECIAEKTYEMVIPSHELPHPESLPDICEELQRNGFPSAAICEEGIRVILPQ